MFVHAFGCMVEPGVRMPLYPFLMFVSLANLA
ncbi:hypothetical protein CMUS01_05624 [Colletotrichum musicola]|uniref:Uncharacterized protein n=1 Tax=Colletotrichum musicola TaxID=2175873 RepID=A0A8H6KR95_9PEZI|nr:hypothetical protein CMUS01_05624 [Colletotrichum musicola]